MTDGLGLSVGATNLTAVAVGRAAVTRSAVVTLFPNRPLEVGLPSENPRLNAADRGVVITDFVDRVGDPVGIIAPDGTAHRGEALLAEALRALFYEVSNGRAGADPVVVTHPAHWRPAAVEALRGALSQMREFSATVVISDATAAITALRNDPGLPTSGLVALCDFGGSGTSITLVDAVSSQPVGQTVRYTDLSGDLIDKAVLTQVLDGLSQAGAVDVTGTSAIGPLNRLRTQCRAAKERLSTTAATSLAADLPGHRGEVRLTRNELDEAIRRPLTDFAGALRETLDRNGVRGPVAVASTGGGARIPLITTTLSEHFGVPVITTASPELTSAIGGGLAAAHGMTDEGATAMADAVSPPTAAAAAVAATQMAPEVHPSDYGSGSSGLAWSEADDVPDVVATDPYDYGGGAITDAMGGGPRPQMQFEPETGRYETTGKRSPFALLVAGLIVVLLAIALAVWFVLRNNESTPSPSSTTETTTTTAAVPPPPTEAPPATNETPPQEPPPVTQTITRAPETATQQAPPPATSEAPPPPPPTSEAPPPTSEAPPTSSERPRLVPTLPYETIPGLPFVPRPIQPPAPAP